MSRIPTRTRGATHSISNHHGNHMHLDNLSPLEKLRLEYQEKLLLEKEKKILTMYERRNDEALAKVRKYPSKRNHTDALVTNGTSSFTGHGTEKIRYPTSYSDSYKKRAAVSAKQHLRIRKPQKLPPINNVKKSSSFHSTAHEEKMYSEYDLQSHSDHNNGGKVENQSSELQSIEENSRSSPPNTKHLRLLRERKLRQRQLLDQGTNDIDDTTWPHDAGVHEKRKLSEFEKWQQEQDDQRFARLHKYTAQHEDHNVNLTGTTHNSYNHTLIESNTQNPVRKMKKHPRGKPPLTSVPTNKSKSPVMKRDSDVATKRKEILRQGIGNQRRIAELEEEILKKQMDLRKMQEHENSMKSVSDDNSASESSCYDSQYSNSYAPISKPIKVPSKRLLHDYSNSNASHEDEEIAFQRKPVLVRRDGSQGSSRGDGTPQKDRTYVRQNQKKKRKDRDKSSTVSHKLVNDTTMNHSSSLHHVVEHDHQSAYPIDHIREDEKNVVLNLVPCSICGRKFAEDRLAMHSKVCAKNQGKKRKVYDMTKARTKGTDAEKFVRRKAFKRGPSPHAKQSDWRRKHEDFINAIRNAKLVSDHVAKGGKLSDLPPPPPSENPDYVRCQYCQRRFNPMVAERHIPRCKDIKSRPKPPKRQ